MLQSGGVSKESPIKGRFTKAKGSMGWRSHTGGSSWEPLPLTSLKGQEGVMPRPGPLGCWYGVESLQTAAYGCLLSKPHLKLGGKVVVIGVSLQARSRGRGSGTARGEPLLERGR